MENFSILNENRYIRAKNIQKMFSIARSTVDNWVRFGYLTRYKIGGGVFFDVNEVNNLIKVKKGSSRGQV